MKKFLYNINNTSWFYKNGENKVGKVEMPYTIGILTFCLIGIALGFEGARDIAFGLPTLFAAIPFLLFMAQYVIYGMSGTKASKETQDHFWKTQMWRFRDASFDWQKTLYPNAKQKLIESEARWEDEYEMTPDETQLNAPFMQKGYRLVLAGIGGVISMTLVSYFINLLIMAL